MKEHPKIGLALGGGGARGIAHVGVLKVLEREEIPLDLIIGTSIGALVGAAYAINPDAAALEKRVSEVLSTNSKENKGLKLLRKTNWDSDS
jgi:NTE family protein